MADDEPADAPTEEPEVEQAAAPPAEPEMSYMDRIRAIDTRTPMQKALDAIPRSKEDTRDLFWTDVLAFYQVLGKDLDGEELQNFQKKYNPENKESIPQSLALPALTEFIGKDEFIIMLQVESKVLDPKHEGTVHHAEDFRMMLRQLGDDIGEDLCNDFIREALGRGDDEFDINVYLQFMCQETHYTEEVKKSKVGR